MRGILLAGLSVMLCPPVERAFAQDVSAQDTLARQEARGESSQQPVLHEPIVIEGELFTLEFEVGVFFDTYCYKPVTIDPCLDVRRLLEEHGVMSEIVAAIAREMEEDLEGIKGELERSYRKQIRMDLEWLTGDLIDQERQRDR